MTALWIWAKAHPRKAVPLALITVLAVGQIVTEITPSPDDDAALARVATVAWDAVQSGLEIFAPDAAPEGATP